MPSENKNEIYSTSDIFDSRSGDVIHTGKVFVSKYKTLYHIFELDIEIEIDKILPFIQTEFHLDELNILHSKVNHQKKKNGNLKPYSIKYIVELRDKLLVEIFNDGLMFYYADLALTDELKKVASNFKEKEKKKKFKRKFYMLGHSEYSSSGLAMQPFEVKEMKIDLAESYNDDIIPIDTAVKAFISDKSQSGLVMLHGKYGTGKSTYIRHLMHTVNKRFIYIPLHVMFGISSPNLLSFFAEYKNSVLILEDCEELLKPRNSMRSGGEALVNLLNLADGLLSDALSLKLICTFNANLKQIDPAILRKGRLAVRYEFKPLETAKANKLAEAKNIDINITEPTTIAEIFNQNQVLGNIQNETNVGF